MGISLDGRAQGASERSGDVFGWKNRKTEGREKKKKSISSKMKVSKMSEAE